MNRRISMKSFMPLTVLLIACAAGLAFNIRTVAVQESLVLRGEQWRFRIEGFDPLDPFRGRYIQFSVSELQTVPDGFAEGQTVYVSLERDGEGFARTASVSAEKPASDGGWLALKHIGAGSTEPLFSRYYVNEKIADELDRRFASSRGKAYITVRIRRGKGAITGLGFAD